MAIIFEEESHKYSSVDAAEKIEWVSVTTLVAKYKEHFDGKAIAEKSSKKKLSKWFGIAPNEIQRIWKKESDRACGLGTFYHKQREDELLGLNTITRGNEILPLFQPIVNEKGYKVAPEQRLNPGIYPEHMCYLKSTGICGQSDLVEVYDGKVHITDYKTNKEIQMNSFVNWEGVSKKMLRPLTHIEDCHINHYSLQLSIYLYTILKHNPHLQAGNLIIHHISFEEENEKDEYGYPLHKLDESGEPIVKSVTIYNLPYLKDEVIKMLEHHKAQKR